MRIPRAIQVSQRVVKVGRGIEVHRRGEHRLIRRPWYRWGVRVKRGECVRALA